MQESITEKNYPIEAIWVAKSVIGLFVFVLFFGFYSLASPFADQNAQYKFNSNLFIYFIILFVSIVITILRRLSFHYSVDEKYLNLKQGILSRQDRDIPYGVIQNVYVKQDLFDRIFGLASLSLENASMGAGAMATPRSNKNMEMVGFSGNRVSIPGLKKENAETLKNIILQKMKENPVEDSQSGL